MMTSFVVAPPAERIRTTTVVVDTMKASVLSCAAGKMARRRTASCGNSVVETAERTTKQTVAAGHDVVVVVEDKVNDK